MCQVFCLVLFVRVMVKSAPPVSRLEPVSIHQRQRKVKEKEGEGGGDN